MGDTLIADLRHYLEEDGTLARMPKPAELLAKHLCTLVEVVTSRRSDNLDKITNVPCRRRPGHKPCPGFIIAFIPDDEPTVIRWGCPCCDDNGYIRGWEDSLWDRRGRP